MKGRFSSSPFEAIEFPWFFSDHEEEEGVVPAPPPGPHFSLSDSRMLRAVGEKLERTECVPRLESGTPAPSAIHSGLQDCRTMKRVMWTWILFCSCPFISDDPRNE